jgi:Sulfotransferase domain
MARERGAANDNYSNLPEPVAELAKAIVLAPRRLNASRRRLPDFLIIGGQRCGTTSVYRYLVAHPQVEGAYPSKGAHYFDNHPDRSLGWYRSHFPVSRGASPITGEGSPYYLFHPHVPARVARVAPEVRLIVMLRDPVERAYSHYQQEYARGFEPSESFERALELEPQRMDGEQERMAADPRYRSLAHQHHSYVARGLYLEQIEAWRQHFPAERMLIIHAERFFADPAAGMAAVQTFLGIDPAPTAEYRAHNARGYAPMDPATRRMLEERFADPNRRLYAYLGVDYGWGAQRTAVA